MTVEIEPCRLCGTVPAISSKSDVHRFLLAAALSKGTSSVRFSTVSDDIRATLDVITALGAAVRLEPDSIGYRATVTGGNIPASVSLNAKESGTTARLVLPIAAALCETVTVKGEGTLLFRPFDELCFALRENGVSCSDDHLPITTKGKLKSGTYRLRGDISSQYISGLLFALPLLEGDSEIVLTTPLLSSGYVSMTLDTLSRFGIVVEKTQTGFFVRGGQRYTPVSSYMAEGDWSSAAVWLCAGALSGPVTITGLSLSSHQKDAEILSLLREYGAFVTVSERSVTVSENERKALNVDGKDIPDLIPILSCLLALANGESRIDNAERLRYKESDRLKTTAALITSLGGEATVSENGLRIIGKQTLFGGRCTAANDHRIAMCAAVLSGSVSNPIRLECAETVGKSYPSFWEDFEKLGGKYRVCADGQ